jgi:hypothetical protein
MVPAQQTHYLLDDGQTEPDSRDLICLVIGLPKTIEDEGQRQRRDAISVVRHDDLQVRIASLYPDLNFFSRGRKFDRIGEKVPYQAIVEAANKVAARLIVMSTHGRTGLAHVLFGSAAERVVQHATCPVLRATRIVTTKATFGGRAKYLGEKINR